MGTLDRVFITTCWDAIFPASLVKALPRLGSDHTPLVVNTGALPIQKSSNLGLKTGGCNRMALARL